MRLLAGDDRAEDHHDVEVMDEAGTVAEKRRLPEGAAGIARLHDLTGRHLPQDETAGRRSRARRPPRPPGRRRLRAS